MKKKYLFIIVVSIIALVNAGYLSQKAYYYKTLADYNGSSFCDLSGSVSCSSVLQSPYSLVFGIPFPWIALAVYPVLLILAYLGLRRQSVGFAKVLAVLSGMGMLFNFFIMYREIVFIKAFCILCFFCTLIIISIFATSLSIIKKNKAPMLVS